MSGDIGETARLIKGLDAENERLRAENLQQREIIDGYSRTGYTVMRARLSEAAAFLDRMADRLFKRTDVASTKDAADCRAKARELRGET